MKSCLVVLAVAVLASCSADPTASSGGKDVTISASPAAVSLQLGSTTVSTAVTISGTDALGGSVDGLYKITSAPNAAFTATVDTTYRPVYAGSKLTTQTRINVVAVAPGVGSFTVQGPGGTLTIPVRIYPDAKAFNATYSTHAPATGDTVTATAPAGIRFTSSTAVSFYKPSATGGDSVTNGLVAPVVIGLSTDSATISFVAAPNATGAPKFTGVSTTQTPTLTVTVKAPLSDSFTPSINPAAFPVAIDKTNPALGDTVTVSVPAGWIFTKSDSGTVDIKPTNGGAKPLFAGWVISGGDTVGMKIINAPGASGTVYVPHLIWKARQAFNYAVTGTQALTGAAPPAFVLSYSRADSNPNTVVTVTMPAGYKATPASVLTVAGVTADGNGTALQAIPMGDSTTRSSTGVARADSNSITVLLPPSSNGAVSITHVRMTAAPGFDFTKTDANLSPKVKPVADLGGDDPAGAVPTFSLPVKGQYGIWDIGTFQVEDQSADGGGPGINSQVYRLQLGVAASLISDVRWSVGRDVDVMLLADSTTTGGTVYGGGSGATGNAYHETQVSNGLAAATYLLDLIDWSPAYPDTPAVGATIRIAITAK